MEPIANETWKSFRRSFYRARLPLLLASLGEGYVGQPSRMLRIPPARVKALLHGRPEQGYSNELSLLALGLAAERPTANGRAYAITAKVARSVAASRARERPLTTRGALDGQGARWSIDVHGRAGGLSSVSWSFDG